MEGLTVAWMINRNLVVYFKQATSVSELKKMVAERLFGNRQPDAAFIKGAKLINWEYVYKFVENYGKEKM